MPSLAEHLKDGVPSLFVVGIRGYYSKMGQTPDNDINLYDDAIIVVGKDYYRTFNANTDPSFAKKGLATLMKGRYQFYRGKHRGRYNALRAYPEGVKLPCTRDGKITVCQYINIHKGGTMNGKDGVTWSQGCQTLPPQQWTEFIQDVYTLMNRHDLKVIDYILV